MHYQYDMLLDHLLIQRPYLKHLRDKIGNLILPHQNYMLMLVGLINSPSFNPKQSIVLIKIRLFRHANINMQFWWGKIKCPVLTLSCRENKCSLHILKFYCCFFSCFIYLFKFIVATQLQWILNSNFPLIEKESATGFIMRVWSNCLFLFCLK